MKQILLIFVFVLFCKTDVQVVQPTFATEKQIELHDRLLSCSQWCDKAVSIEDRDFSLLILKDSIHCICKDGRTGTLNKTFLLNNL